MANIRSKGALTKWFDDKGFGFITPDKDKKEVFVHISAFGQDLQRRPKAGDTIFYYLQKDEDGKIKAYDVIIEGVQSPAGKESYRPRKSYSERSTRKSSILFNLVIILAIGIGATAYQRYFSGRGSFILQRFSGNPVQTSSRYTCAGKTRCSQMISCEEATFYLQNCPGTLADGDRDGIPCEDQHCH